MEKGCFTCGKIDRFKRDFPKYKRRKSLRAQSANTRRNEVSRSQSAGGEGPRVSVLQVESKTVNEPERKCYVNGIKKICTLDLRCHCLIIIQSEASLLDLKFKKTGDVLSGFNYATVIPIAQSYINCEMDGISLHLKFYIAHDDQLSHSILFGRKDLE